ncbi:MAG: hypothetical protein CMO44_18435 [Verrucomicrobiales bacterium]|nr:hypothetical protein [Verrucomicrobiales bacterium]
MSCEPVDSSLFSFDTNFGGYYCKKNFNVFFSVIIFQSFMAFISIFISTRRYQEERRLLNVARGSPEWNQHFGIFLSLVGVSNILHVINFLLLVNSNMVQIIITVLVRIMGYFALHQLNFVGQDFQQYKRVDLGIN